MGLNSFCEQNGEFNMQFELHSLFNVFVKQKLLLYELVQDLDLVTVIKKNLSFSEFTLNRKPYDKKKW